MKLTSWMATKNITHDARKKLAIALRILHRIILTGRCKIQKPREVSRVPSHNFAFVIIFLFAGCQDEGMPAFGAEPITDSQAIRIIVGEAADQSYLGMIAVGEVIRANGHISAFKGLNAKHSAHESKKTWIEASRAWHASANSNITMGANHFDNVEAFGEPYWAPNCETTVVIDQTYFFKC